MSLESNDLGFTLSQLSGKELVVKAGLLQLFHIFLVPFVYSGNEPEGCYTYHTVNVLLGVQKLGCILDSEVLIAYTDSCSMGKYPLSSARGDWWVWVFRQVEGHDKLGRGSVVRGHCLG